MRKIDLVGQKFGKLTVIKEAPHGRTKSGHSFVRWYCKCECGNPNLVIVSSNNLKTGNTNSCGCYFKERMVESNKKYKHKTCKYDLETYDYGVGTTDQGEVFLFDKEDYDLIKDYCWYKKYNYFTARNPETGKYEVLSRIIMGIYNKDNNPLDVDHINTHCKNDNRKQNLRIVTKQQNNWNHAKPITNNSGETGVSWHKRLKKWQSYITYNNKRIYLGVYKDFNMAVKARKEAEEKYYGEYSYDNSQKIANSL